MKKAGNKTDSMKMNKYKKTQGFQMMILFTVPVLEHENI